MQTYLRKYGVQTTLHFTLFEVDGVDFRVDAVDAGADCSIMKDEGVEATCTNDFADEGTGYSLVVSATEMQAAEIMIYVVDLATKVWLDEVLKIETYGNASAMHAEDFSITKAAALATYDSPTKAEMDTALVGLQTAQLLVATTIGSNNRSTTSCELVAGSDNNNAYVGMKVILDDDSGDLEYVSRTITGYIGVSKTVTWSPAITEVAVDGGLIYIIPGDTKINVTADALPTAAEIQAEMEENGASLLDTIRDELANGADGLSALKTLIDAVQAKTDNLPVDPASVSGAVGSVTGNVIGSVGSLAAQAKADVNAEVVDTLNVDMYPEPGQGAPAAAVSIVTKIGHLFKSWRNKKDNDGTTRKIYNDAGTAVDQKSTVSEATGTVTVGEVESGP